MHRARVEFELTALLDIGGGVFVERDLLYMLPLVTLLHQFGDDCIDERECFPAAGGCGKTNHPATFLVGGPPSIFSNGFLLNR